MRRYLFLIPLFLLVFAAPRVAEAQSFCSLSGVEWTRCYDFRTSDHGFVPTVTSGTPGTFTRGQYVPGVGFQSLAGPSSTNSTSSWRQWVHIVMPDQLPVNVQQVKVIYELTPGRADSTSGNWVSVDGVSFIWTRDEFISGAGTLHKTSEAVAIGLTFQSYASICSSCTEDDADGTLTIIALVFGGTGTPPLGEEPSTGGGDGGAPAELVIDVTPLYESISAYIPMFLVLFAIPGGIVIAVSLVRMIVNAVGNAIKSASGNG